MRLWRRAAVGWALAGAMGTMAGAQQTTPAANGPAKTGPAATAQTDPGKALLFDLEARFAQDVLKRGGVAFAEWFAEDGVTLGNGAAPTVGRVAIAKNSSWKPDVYQLSWTPTDAKMGPSGDMGFTWGHFEGHSRDANGNPVTVTGRYMTIWRKQTDGSWKVMLDAGANEPKDESDCCRLTGKE